MAGDMTLVVDDDASLGEALRTTLAGNAVGFEVTGDVGTAIAMLDSHRFCGLILDLVVDGGSGVDVLAYMRAHNLAIPTVIVSEKLPDSVREMLDGDNVKLVIHKPVEPRLLASIVLGLCGIPV